MRSILRFLLVAVVVFGGLSGRIQPAHADGKLAAGSYVGQIEMAIHAHYHMEMSDGLQTYDMPISINFFWNPLIQLQIADDAQGIVTVWDTPMDVYDYTFLSMTGQVNCTGSVFLKAKGSYTQLTTGVSNFDQQNGGKIVLGSGDLESIERIQDTQNCPFNSLFDSQANLAKHVSTHLTQIILKVTNYTAKKITGKCSVPGWEIEGKSNVTSYKYVTDSCFWWVNREGDRKWKRK